MCAAIPRERIAGMLDICSGPDEPVDGCVFWQQFRQPDVLREDHLTLG